MSNTARDLATRAAGVRATAGRAFALVALSWLTLALAAGPAAAKKSGSESRPEPTYSPDGPGPLPWHVTGLMGFTVDAVAFPDSGGISIDLYLRLPPATLRRMLADSPTGTARIQAELKSGYHSSRQTAEQTIEVTPADTTGEFGQVVLLRFPSKFGPQQLRVRVDDLTEHVTKVARLWGNGRTASVSGDFNLPTPKDGRMLSHPEFVWDEEVSAKGPFQRLGKTLIPNPERLYGLYSTDLHVAFAAVTRESKPWSWRVRVLDERKQPIAATESTGVAGTRLDAEARLDVSQLPSGGYDLELTAWQEGDANPLRVVSRFSIAWHVLTWIANPDDVANAIHFLLEPNDEERFSRLQPGEQERWMEAFWKRRDPNPDTAINEAREAFLARVRLANDRFGRAGQDPGMFSDMGRVFIRYGEPNEVEKQVIPTGDETLRQIIDQLSFEEARELGTVHTPGLGGDMRPYEVWVYEGTIPLPIEVEPDKRNVRHKRLLFLFVDDRGIGDYRMRYSNE